MGDDGTSFSLIGRWTTSAYSAVRTCLSGTVIDFSIWVLKSGVKVGMSPKRNFSTFMEI